MPPHPLPILDDRKKLRIKLALGIINYMRPIIRMKNPIRMPIIKPHMNLRAITNRKLNEMPSFIS
jgi:hypothetical protein